VGFNLSSVSECLPMFSVFFVAWWMARRATTALTRAVVIIPFSAAVLFWLMAFKELRWWTVSFGFLFGVVVVVISVVDRTEQNRNRRWLYWLAGLALFLPGLADAFQTVRRNDQLAASDMLGLAERDIAHSLRQRTGSGPFVVLGAPATTSQMIYFGGAQGLGTPYWENLDGMKRAARIIAAQSMEEAHILIRAAGVTHLVFLSWDDFNAPYARLARGLSVQAPLTTFTFGTELVRRPFPPPWLRRLPDHLPEHPLFKDRRVLIFEVTDRTRPEQALVRDANFLLYRDQVAAAASLRPQLQGLVDDLAAQVALARVYAELSDGENFGTTFERIGQLMNQTPTLEPEDRMHLITLLAVSGQTTEARAELIDALRTFDETALRQLTPGSLMNLLTLAERFNAKWPDARRRDFAMRLVPPDGRR
jgi:hypothetical protein